MLLATTLLLASPPAPQDAFVDIAEDFLFARSLAELGDVDGDGVPDVAIGQKAAPDGTGCVWLISGRDGYMLRRFCAVELRGEEDGWEFGASIAGVGDVDRDGCEELAIGAPAGDGEGPAVVRVLSLRTGEVLRAMSRHEGEFGRALAHGITPGGGLLAVGGDSVLDGAVSCFDLATGELRWQARSPASDYFGAALCAVGDVDGDGWTDFAAGCDGKFSRVEGAAVLLSGKSGERLCIANAAGLRRELERR